MASDKAKALAAKQKAQMKAEKQRRKNSTDPKDWGQVKQVVEAYKATARIDNKLNPYLGLGALATILVIAGFGIWFKVAWWAWVPLALMTALTVGMFILTRRAKKATFTQYAGQPGSAEIGLQHLNKKKYTYDVAITATRQLDIIHRVVGPCGVVLIGEGQPGRVQPLLASEAKKHEQVAYGTKVTTLVLGDGSNQVKLPDLQKTIQKLPKTMETYQIAEVRQRLKALDAVRPKAPIPKGPTPTMKGINRAMRGR